MRFDRYWRLASLAAAGAIALSCGSACNRPQPPTSDGGNPSSEPTEPIKIAADPAVPKVELEPAQGAQLGLSFEAFLSPHQEPDEEDNTPKGTPAVFQSTQPSNNRKAREAAGHRGHGKLRFSKDFSRAYVDVRIEGVKPQDINMFHIHCGKPGILGPILVDFAHTTDIKKSFADGTFSVEVVNEHLVKTSEHGHGLVATFAHGCVIPSPSLGGLKPTKVSTIAGMARLAMDGELYFNLHTVGQTYYGDIRGQLYAEEP